MARNSPNHGEVLRIREILDMPVDVIEGKTVRITGKMVSHDIQVCDAVVKDSQTGRVLCVDTSLVEPLSVTTGSLVQCIGEMDGLSEKYDRVLRARTLRGVEGLDLIVYNKALDKQRQYLQSREQIT